jgi:hypothetical protein
MDLLTFSIIPTNTGGEILFAWHESSDHSCMKLIESLRKIEDKGISNAIGRFIFEHFENIAISPIWWEGLGIHHQENINKRIMSSISPMHERTNNCLMDDGIHYLDWQVCDIRHNLSLGA